MDDEVEVFVASAGEVDENGTGDTGPGDTDSVSQGVRALDRGDDSLVSGEKEEGLNGVLVIDGCVFDAVHLVQQCMFGACGGIIETAGIGIDRGGIAVFIGQHDALEAVHDAFCAVGDGSGIVAQPGAPAQRLYTDELDGICQEGSEHTDRVGTAADTGCYLVRKMSGLFDKLSPGFFSDAVLEVADHQREGVGACGSADTVDSVFVFFGISHECGVNCLFEGLESEADRNDVCAEELHTCHIGSLFGDIDFAHIDVALKSEIGSCSCKCNAVLACPGLGDEFLFAHIFCKETFAHAVVELMGTRVVEIFTLKIDLSSA